MKTRQARKIVANLAKPAMRPYRIRTMHAAVRRVGGVDHKHLYEGLGGSVGERCGAYGLLLRCDFRWVPCLSS